MSAHAQAKTLPFYRPHVWKCLKTAELKEEHLNVRSLLLAFRLKEEGSDEEALWKLRQVLQRMGFRIENEQLVDKLCFEFKLLRCYLLANSEEPGLLEGMLQLAQCVHSSGGWKQELRVGEEFREHLSILRKVAATVRTNSLEDVHEEERLAVLLIRHDEHSPLPS
jgi:hypothetical protein